MNTANTNYSYGPVTVTLYPVSDDDGRERRALAQRVSEAAAEQKARKRRRVRRKMADPKRGNRVPANPKRWPCDQRQLVNDLWATALHLLPEAADIWVELEDEDEVFGRDFEPWRGLIAIARLFQRHGVADLEKDVRSIMLAYLRGKSHILGGDDRPVQVIKALVTAAEARWAANPTIRPLGPSGPLGAKTPPLSDVKWSLPAKQIVAHINGERTEEDDEPDEDDALGGMPVEDAGSTKKKPKWPTAKQVGRIMGNTLRFDTGRAEDAKRTRIWWVSDDAIQSLACAYRVDLSDKKWPPISATATKQTPDANGQDGHDGLMVSEDGDAEDETPPPKGQPAQALEMSVSAIDWEKAARDDEIHLREMQAAGVLASDGADSQGADDLLIEDGAAVFDEIAR